ncbi:MAG: hypothetical protein ABIY70_10050 [Capsulimonas sp.]|uniref:helix-turn-helix domain-containing protein n=1 Tax=Capsulimonas sp. TaxID=2494211 RepID=UPI003266F287
MDLSTREGRRKQGGRIKRAAKDAGLSLDDLASRVGCSRALIYQYVSGALLAQSNRLQVIGEIVNKPLDYFFAADEPPVSEASAEKRSDEPSWIRERVLNLRKLLDAYSLPADPRAIADTCQQIRSLIEAEGDALAIAEILFKHGDALIQLQDFGSAKAKFQEAGSLFREGGRSGAALSCLQSLGHINVQLGRTDEAMKLFEEVSQGQSWQHRWQGALSLGAVHEVLGNYAASADLFMQATEIVEENANRAETEIPILFIESNWANLDLDWGEYTSAMNRAERCVALAQKLGIQDQYVEAKLTRGIALLELYEIKSALSEVSTALDVSQLLRDNPRRSIALSYRSRCQSAILKPDEAVIDAKEALTLALRCGANRAEVLAQQVLVEAYLSAGNYPEAQYHIDQASSAAESQGLRLQQAQSAVLRSRLFMVTGQLDSACEMALGALSIANTLEAKSVILDAHLLLASTNLARKRWEDARIHADAAVTLATASRTIVSLWTAYWRLASAQWKLGDMAAARLSFESALGHLSECRWRFVGATGLDTYYNAPGVVELLQRWLNFLEETDETYKAGSQSIGQEWSALEQFDRRGHNARSEALGRD